MNWLFFVVGIALGILFGDHLHGKTTTSECQAGTWKRVEADGTVYCGRVTGKYKAAFVWEKAE